MVVLSVKTYPAPEYNVGEIFRYARANEQSLPLIGECMAEAEGALCYKVCYCILPVTVEDDRVDFGLVTARSSDLARCVKGSSHAVIFCATVGVGIDRLINKYGTLSPAKALVFQALGTERVEGLCNAFNEDIKREFGDVRPRFSPGYGDLPLEFQREIFDSLNLGKRVGVSLGNSMIMSPSKSVTGIIGVSMKDCR